MNISSEQVLLTIVIFVLALLVVSQCSLLLSLRHIAIANSQATRGASERSAGFLDAVLAVFLTLALWFVVFRCAYWIAHGQTPRPSSSPESVGTSISPQIAYSLLDYMLLFGSLMVAVWPVFQLLNPPRDLPPSTTSNGATVAGEATQQGATGSSSDSGDSKVPPPPLADDEQGRTQGLVKTHDAKGAVASSRQAGPGHRRGKKRKR